MTDALQQSGKSIDPSDLTYDQLKSKDFLVQTTEQVLDRNIYGSSKVQLQQDMGYEKVTTCNFNTTGCQKEFERETKAHIKQHCKESKPRHQSIRIGRALSYGFENYLLPCQETKSAGLNVRH